ncbi:MAG TPA: efflux RND transporter periplasmic adaptor subunit [Desulfuromonadales bacterium]|nr:efflux RND transporter periplasmic adaptor subunit [Desulfuromonadales bacterium]
MVCLYTMAREDLQKLKIDKRGAARPRRSGVVWRWTAFVLVLLALLFLTRWVFFPPTVEVEVTTVSRVYPSLGFTVLNASGYVVAQRKAAVAAKTTGRLEWLGVEEGSRVREGEVIARLESRDVAAARDRAAAGLERARAVLAEADAEANEAELSFRRFQELLAGGFVSRAEYDAALARRDRARAGVASARAAVAAAAAELREAEVAFDYTRVRAPFDAVVLTKNADIGDILTPIGAAAEARAAVVNIADLDSLQVEADVSESSLEKVGVGQPCEIRLDALPEERFAGEVHMIVPTADRSKATVLVKVRFLDPDPRILPEMSARVAFLARAPAEEERTPRTALHAAALRRQNGRTEVFVIRAGRAVATPVTPGEAIGDLVEIREGVETGEKVVLRPLEKMRDGIRVKTPE